MIIKCLICGKVVPSKHGLANHLWHKHNMSSKEYKTRFAKELRGDLIEGEDYLLCPICNKECQRLSTHLSRTHKLSKDEINNLIDQKVSNKMHNVISKNCKKNLHTSEVHKKISDTKKERWTPEDTKRLYESRIQSGCYSLIGKKRNQHLVDKFDSYEQYLDDVVNRLSGGLRGNRIISEDSYGPVKYRSTYEYRLSRLLNKLNVTYRYEPFWLDYTNPNDNSVHKYNPDFLIEDYNLVLEVKPNKFINEVTEAKRLATVNKGYIFEYITEDKLNISYLSKLLKI